MESQKFHRPRIIRMIYLQIIPDEIDAKFHQTLPTQYMMQQLFNSKLAKKSTTLFSKIRSNCCKTIDFLKEYRV